MLARTIAIFLWLGAATTSAAVIEPGKDAAGPGGLGAGNSRALPLLAQVSTVYGKKEARRIAIEVKPGSAEKIIRVKTERVFPIAILGAEDLDVIAINPRTIRVNAAGGKLVGGSDTRTCKREDANADGYQDLVCQVKIAAFRVEAGETVMNLVAESYDRVPLRGEAEIQLVTD
ncbi:MAG: hypothetical protein OEN02_15780 [Gammaproteobacteria bacterium]|nr:hypothetical protein [Gammaproteobacteria bacterium]